MKTIIILILVLSAGLFLYNVKRVSDLTAEYAALKEEVKQKTSGGALVGSFTRAFFDGLTLGAFADEGIFTEYNKADRWTTDVASRDARIRSEYADSISNRKWSLIVALGCIAALVFWKSENIATPAS